MDKREFVIILSDIHIGTAMPCVWYQKEIHEKYLMAILNDIITYANQIQQVILLGDIFEFWTYPPCVVPPTLEDIIATHPNILGVDGKLRQAINALEGRMVFIPGDHDMNLTQNDLNKLKTAYGYTIKVQPGTYIPVYDTHIKFTHGHEFTFLNAPYYKSKIAPIPIAYFIYKAIAYKLQNDIKRISGLTVASLEEYGTYSLTDLFSKLSPFLENYENDIDFVGRLIDAIADYTKIPKDMCIKVNKNTSVTLNEVKKIYKNLNNDFLQFMYSRGQTSQTIELKDLVQLNISYLPGYMKKSKSKDLRDVIVMGHTHIPEMSVEKDNVKYINTGFMCPSIPNLKTTPITYGIYSLLNQNINLMKASTTNNPVKIKPIQS